MEFLQNPRNKKEWTAVVCNGRYRTEVAKVTLVQETVFVAPLYLEQMPLRVFKQLTGGAGRIAAGNGTSFFEVNDP